MKICVSITEPSAERALRAGLEAEKQGADMVEIRFDHMRELPDGLEMFDSIKVPKIATLRNKAHGGRYDRDEELRKGFLVLASLEGFEYIDIEMGSRLMDELGDELGGSSIICSHHDFEGTPDKGTIEGILTSCAEMGEVAKAAFSVRSVSDLRTIVAAAEDLRSMGRNFVLIGMGDLGMVTRVASDEMGCWVSYASWGERKGAPGQLDLQVLRRLKERRIITGITGHPLSHSLSPQMHNAAFEHLSLPGIYLTFPATSEELEGLLELLSKLGFRGLNVTIPHKERIIPLLDCVDETARRVGAVNTVVNDDGTLIGMNTDVEGLAQAFTRAGEEVSGRKALIVGAGGAARAAVAFLTGAGAEVWVINRTPERARALADDFEGVKVAPTDLSGTEPDVIVNCTPLGMRGFPERLPIPAELLKEGMVVMDTIYNPKETMLLKEARGKGARTISGIEMLIYQAIAAFDAWTGVSPPSEIMDQALRGAL